MSHEKQWSSATPGLLIILVDQSGSMMSAYEGETRTSYASKAINRVINEIIEKNFDGDKPKNRCFIAVIGYNHNVKEICSGYLSKLYENPLRTEQIKRKTPDGAGGIIEVTEQMPIWVEPINQDGATNMKGAFLMAKQLVEKWMNDKPDNPAPVIINISDGIPYYEGKDPRVCMSETVDLVNSIKNLSCDDGGVLVFNAEVGDNGNRVVFPNDVSAVSSAGEGAQFLYNITSVVPDGYKDAATKNELPITPNSRGCIFHADGVDLINLINFGSSKGQKDRLG